MSASFSESRALAYSPFVRIVDRLQTDVLLILEEPVELWMLTVKRKFCKQKEDVLPNKRSVTFKASAPPPALAISGRVRQTHLHSAKQKMMLNHVPLRPSPDTPRARLSIPLTFCCASLTDTGWPSWSTLCIVIRALNVWTSSAITGCL